MPPDEELRHPSHFTDLEQNKHDEGSYLESSKEESSPTITTTTTTAAATEYQTPTSTKFIFLALYFFFNLTLTLSNKSILTELPYPWLLTTFHTTSASIGTITLLLLSRYGPQFGIHTFHNNRYLSFSLSKLPSIKSHLVLVAFSVLFTLNIALSNISLSRVSLPFHQILRSTVPIFTIVFFRFLFNRTYSSLTYYSLIPLVIGPAIATYGDYYFSFLGFVLTLLGVISASVKTIVTNKIMTGSLALPAMELLFRMSPLAAVQAFMWASSTGEVAGFMADITSKSAVAAAAAVSSPDAKPAPTTTYLITLLIANSILAFFLNVISFQTNKLAGPLTISVCGNLKQVFTIVLGIILFHVRVTFLNGLGMCIALAGAAWYSKVELDNKTRQKSMTAKPASGQFEQSATPLLPLHSQSRH